MIGILDQLIDDIAAGRIDVPVATTTPALLLDADGDEVDGPSDVDGGFEPSIDGFDIGAPLDPGITRCSPAPPFLDVRLH